jgi:hypothetical protein
MTDDTEPAGEAGVAEKAKRFLKGSGRFIMDGVKAALAGDPNDPTAVVAAWRHGSHDLRRERTSLFTLVSACLARQTSACAEKGIDLLLDQADRLPEAEVDAVRLQAALEVTLEAARAASAPSRTIRVRTAVEPRHAAVIVVVQPEHEAPSVAEGSNLDVARAIVEAHGGALVLEPAPEEGHIALKLTLPSVDPSASAN